MGTEIERKFLLKGKLSDYNFEYTSIERIEQCYVMLEDNKELRVRMIRFMNSGQFDEVRYVMTAKAGEGLIRTEVEVEISKKEYVALKRYSNDRNIAKKRYTTKDHLMIDVFEDKNIPSIVEVEFPNEDDANKFTPPDWFGEEVTNNINYSNKMLAMI